MCGIAGIHAYHYAAPPVDRSDLDAMSARLVSRGPDGTGTWVETNSRVALTHRRLAIIDPLPSANQPMSYGEGRYQIVYNGEIYNFRELRKQLVERGMSLRTESDTEVLLACYQAYGLQMFARLRGMYSFAIYDCLDRTLLLARDPFGIKPLYYADDGWTCRFASQVKALLAGGVDQKPEPAGHIGFMLFGSVPEPFTLYQEIRAVPAGYYVIVDSIGARVPVRHTSIAGIISERPEHAYIADALKDSVAAHLVSDVPVGCFLSSGVDSSVIASIASQQLREPLKTVTIGFDEFAGTAHDEVPLAEKIAHILGADHYTRRISRAEFEGDLPAIMAAMDQPSIDGINSWFAAKAAAEHGLKVVLSGVGGDEIFGSYPSFKRVPRFARMLTPWRWIPGLAPALQMIAAPVANAFELSPKAAAIFRLAGDWQGGYQLVRGLFMPWELEEIFDPEEIQAGLRRLNWGLRVKETQFSTLSKSTSRVSVLESGLYMKNQLLRDADWASMAHSVEVRTPLVDVDFLRRCPLTVSKHEILQSFPALDELLGGRPKSGFGVPINQWRNHGSARVHWSRSWARTVGQQFREDRAAA